MDIKEQVISLDQAKKLKELGFEQNSHFIYQDYYGNGDARLDYYDKRDHKTVPVGFVSYNAYSVSELMDILPMHFIDWWFNEVWKLSISKNLIWLVKCEYHIAYTNISWLSFYGYRDENLAIALWVMLVYLIENNLLPTPPHDKSS